MKDQRKVSNAIAYRAVRSPGSVVLQAGVARTLSEDLGLLASAWNAHAEAGPDDEPRLRAELHEVLGGVLAELWDELPKSLLSRRPPAPDAGP